MAFLRSGPAREPFFRVPAIVFLLIAALVLAHAARMFVSEPISQRIVGDYAFIPARYSHAYLAAHGIDPGSLFERALPFIAHMFLHADYVHLGINCAWLLAFGPVVARRFGWIYFLLFFALCGVIGAATHLAFNWGSENPVIGASGAISGLMAAGIRMMPSPGQSESAVSRPLMPIFSRQILAFTALWMGINLVFGLTGMGMGSEVRLIAWQAHVGGYLAGLLFSGPFDTISGSKALEPGFDA